MKTSKKILLLLRSITIITTISLVVSYSCNMIWNFPMLYSWILTTILQIWGTNICDYVYERWIYDFRLNEQLQRYADLPYKEYPVELHCEHCRNKQTVFIDLQNSTFQCINCEKSNGIHTTIKIAAISEIPDTIKF